MPETVGVTDDAVVAAAVPASAPTPESAALFAVVAEAVPATAPDATELM